MFDREEYWLQFQTKYFGEIQCDREEILTFPQGLFGFEEEKSFLLLPFAGSDGTLLCFQSTTTPSLAFIAMNPFSLDGSYAPVLRKEELELMEVSRSEDLCYYVFCVVKEPIGESTVNFRCPIAVNPDNRKAVQVILENGDYHMRHKLSEISKKEGPSC